MRRRARTLTTRCRTQREIGPVVVVDKASRCTMEAADGTKEEGTEVIPTTIPDPPEAGGVEATKTGKGKSVVECWYCGKKGHKESECWKKCTDSEKTRSGSGQTDKGTRQRSHYVEGSGKVEKGSTFVTRHEANSMKTTTPKSDKVWYVYSGASNHMTSHKEWFSYLEKPMQPGVVATGDDTPHPIENVGEVPLSHVRQKGKLMNVLHVPTITKNLVSVGQIVDQGMQVRFTHLGCFIEEEGQVIAQGRRDGRMFILDTNDIVAEIRACVSDRAEPPGSWIRELEGFRSPPTKIGF